MLAKLITMLTGDDYTSVAVSNTIVLLGAGTALIVGGMALVSLFWPVCP